MTATMFATETDDRPIFPGFPPAPSLHSQRTGPVIDRPSRSARSLRILAWDPGNVSGTALYDGGKVVHGQVGDRTAEPRERRRAAFGLLCAIAPTLDALAYEHFVAFQGVAEKHADALYIQGAIEYVAHTSSIPCFRYRAKKAKDRVSDDALKALGWYPPWGMRTGSHAADATRILVCTLTDEYPQEMMQ